MREVELILDVLLTDDPASIDNFVSFGVARVYRGSVCVFICSRRLLSRTTCLLLLAFLNLFLNRRCFIV